ncbi:hypothetical protein E2C01_101460 [Portunus trituberculatus]|uniref:Uncharacterized protein n=1 Tax=Portunus trituberculatus TaxID=210409 RepID=A0A5B7K5S0_PORTR|nr:hypothetical protein [Portunus trituberculatus]
MSLPWSPAPSADCILIQNSTSVFSGVYVKKFCNP